MAGLLSDLERKIIMMSEEVCRNALIASAAEIKIDIDNNICYKVSDQYYQDYSPTIYTHRMGSLYDAWKITPFLKGQNIVFNLNLDSDRLPQHTSGSWWHQAGGKWISREEADFNFNKQSNGMPENSWILENFFKGIHPGYTLLDGMVVDNSKTTSTVLQNMQKYITKYRQSGKMQKILLKHLKNQCRKYK